MYVKFLIPVLKSLPLLATLTLAACSAPTEPAPLNSNSDASFGIHAVLQGEDGRVATTLPDGMVLGTDVALHTDQNGESLYVLKPATIGTSCLKSIYAAETDDSAPVLNFTLTEDCAKTFASFTAQHIGHRMALMINGDVITAPSIRGAITGGSGVIDGGFESLEEAKAIARQFD